MLITTTIKNFFLYVYRQRITTNKIQCKYVLNRCSLYCVKLFCVSPLRGIHSELKRIVNNYI